MRLKRLEVYGFKSFANRMVFDFSTGLTVIVGPNGCGKSNVADSIQWIFGEMSAKALRGSGMTDVIFSGSRNRRAYSYAEGTLTFDNTDRVLNYNLDEVSITRSISRSGESEYFINGDRCRLTDIKMLLQGTGLGASDYSIIQQGSVGKMISSDNQSRRKVFDEAAGVSRYKYRRDKAQRKLEKVDFALERLSDNIEATERELRSLKRRASAAQRYQEITEEWQGKDLLLNQLNYSDNKTELDTVIAAREEINRTISEFSVLESKLSADVTQLEETVYSNEKNVNNSERHKIRCENDLAQNEKDIQYLRERNQERNTFCQEKEKENQEHHDKIKARAADIEKLVTDINTIDSEVEAKEAKLRSSEEQLDHVRTEFSRVMEILEGKKRSLEETLAQSGSTKNEIDTLNAEKNALTTNQKESNARLDAMKGDQQELEVRFEGLNSIITSKEAEREALTAKLDEHLDRKAELLDRREVLSHSISDINHGLTRIDSRLHLLRDLEDKYEGISSGVKGILEELKNDDSQLQGIYGMVADFIRVEMQDEEVIETALGEHVQNIIVEKVEHAIKAVDYLRKHNLGKASFMPEEVPHNGICVSDELLAIDGIECAAMDLVQCKEEHADIILHLLGNTVIAADLASAEKVPPAMMGQVTIVTRDGYVFTRSGMISGGSIQKMGGIISRKNEIEKLRNEFNAEKTKLEDGRQEQALIDKELDGIRNQVRALEESIEGIGSEVGENRKQLLKDERDIIHINDQINTIVASIVSTGVRMEEIEEQLIAEEGKYNWFARLAQLLEKEIGVLEERARGLGEERDTIQKNTADLRIDLAMTNGNKEIITEKISHLKQNIHDFKLEIEKNELHMGKTRREVEQNDNSIASKEERMRELTQQLEDADKNLIDYRNSAEEVRSSYMQLKRQYKDTLSESKQHGEQLRQLELKVNNLEHVRDRIEESVLQYHNMDIREANKEFTAPQEGIDRDELERDVKNLFAARSRITGADPTAIEKLQSVQLRAEYLTLQRDDLDKARESLRGLINKINRESARKFSETFETIRENFKLLFRKIFGGGRADLILEPDKDMLEAGVEIVVRPPGSQLQTISLLSGGQKAMVIVCLLFSVLRAKPTPLCLLDEIDGPLDEANIDRFLALVREFMKESQFIIISHNKKTVSKADVIYGVTMQEPGVSKKLCLDFEDIRKDERLLGEQGTEKLPEPEEAKEESVPNPEAN